MASIKVRRPEKNGCERQTHTPADRDKTLFPHLNNKLPIGSALSIIVPEDKCWKKGEKKQSLCREASTRRNIYDQSFASKCHRLRTGKRHLRVIDMGNGDRTSFTEINKLSRMKLFPLELRAEKVGQLMENQLEMIPKIFV